MSYVTEVLADSPLFYYRFGEASGLTAVDASGNGHNGTYTAGITYGVTGATSINDGGLAVTMSAAASMDTGVDAAANPASSDFSVECWMKRNGAPALVGTLVGKYNGSGNKIDLAVDNFGKLSFTLNSTNLAGVATVTNNAWRHIVVTRASGAITVYVDGVVDKTGTQAAACSPGGDVVVGKLGVWELVASNIGPCSIDEVAWYTTALSQARVVAHFTAATTAPPPGPPAATDTGIPLACWWPSHF